MDFLKTVGGKVAGGFVLLAVLIAGISWFRMEPETRSMLLGGTGKILAWFAIVLLVPWVTFAVIGWVDRFQTNAAGALLVLAYTALELVLLLWLFNWSVTTATGWTFLGVGVLLAAAYNLLACDWIAEKVA